MKFSEKIIRWYKKNKRDLPWRKTNDPYKIWLSEIILQQTRIDQGLKYYLKFCDNYPDIKSLARENEEQILKLWQGLGYYSRARNMHKTARFLVENYRGKFPENYSDIIKLKGVGEYTAAAIVSFAFNKVYPVVDGNVIRLLSRLYGIKTAVNSTKGKNKILSLASELIDQEQPGEFNQAIMEFGALQCKPQNPDCRNCILQKECKAFNEEMVSDIPVKINKVKIKKRYFHYFVLTFENQVYLNKRTSNDIWYNLYDFPHIESNRGFSKNRVIQSFVDQFKTPQNQFTIQNISNEYKHILTHQRIFALFYKINILDQGLFQKLQSLNRSQFVCIRKETINQYPLPRLIDKYLSENNKI